MFSRIILIVLFFELCKSSFNNDITFPVKFLFYNRHNKQTEQVYLVTPTDPPSDKINANIANLNFDNKLITKIIINGFWSKLNDDNWPNKMKNEFLKHLDCNVIVVDWTKGSCDFYHNAHENTRIAAIAIEKFIRNLQTAKKLSLKKVHIIGHSLGAHVAGFTGQLFNGQIGRITGLDPAGPGFNDVPDNDRLNSTNADFVDIIHTDSITVKKDKTGISYGIIKNVGHLDFWPNDGYGQPGCLTHVCSHGLAVEYYMASINRDNIKNFKARARACDSYSKYEQGDCNVKCIAKEANCAIMCEDAQLSKQYKDKTLDKNYYLTTTGSHPYFEKSILN